MAGKMAACGVMCSDCPAYRGDTRGLAHQERTVAAWRRIYGLNETTEHISCGGCFGPDEELFHTCRKCEARRCCRSKGFVTCADCSVEACPALETAQSVWDGVPDLVNILSPEDFAEYAQPYCGHRQRLADARKAGQNASSLKHSCPSRAAG